MTATSDAQDPPIADQFEKVPFEQLRFAVVLNGGVSLAVWMGGTVVARR